MKVKSWWNVLHFELVPWLKFRPLRGDFPYLTYEGGSIYNGNVPINRKVLFYMLYNYIPKKICELTI